jgi:diguanylate cyclase (GGDEF)-like protein
MVDIDHFKSINDRHGHQMGDEVLRRVAAAILETLRTEDVAARYGGEEFCLLLSRIDLEDGAGIAERIRQLISDLQFPGLRITASLGVASVGRGAKTPQELLDHADQCLYEAKRAGRNCVVQRPRASDVQATGTTEENAPSATAPKSRRRKKTTRGRRPPKRAA